MDSYARLIFSIKLWIILTVILIVMTVIFQGMTHEQPNQYNEFAQPTQQYGSH